MSSGHKDTPMTSACQAQDTIKVLSIQMLDMHDSRCYTSLGRITSTIDDETNKSPIPENN